MAITLRDVAERSGVSITTVSRILNDRETGVPVRDSTRKRILAAASELGYKPNLLARALRGSRSSLLGVIFRDISDPFHIQILRGINDVAQAKDYRLFLGHVDYRPDVAVAYGSMFEQSHADGIIVIGDLEAGEPAMEQLAHQHRYTVGVTDRTGRKGIPGVYGDSRQGTLMALEHLWQHGHRSIICVSDARTDDGRLRTELYEQFMHDRGAGDHIRSYITDQELEPSYRLGSRIFADIAARREQPTAIYATSDSTAIGLLRAAFDADVKVPEQISMIGFDDIDMAAFTIPPLTTISQSGVEMGRRAAELVLKMIDEDLDPAEVDDVVIAPLLVERQSVVFAPA